MAAALFLAVSAWTGAGLHARLRPPVRTAVVLPGSVTETLELRGLALRRERALLGRGPVTLLPENGQRVAAGQAVAELLDGELLCAPGSALFFSDTDGREDLDPELLEDLDARGLEALMGTGILPRSAGRRRRPETTRFCSRARTGRYPPGCCGQRTGL